VRVTVDPCPRERWGNCPGGALRLACALALLAFAGRALAADPGSFRFVSWADTRANAEVLEQLSRQVRALPLQPALTIYVGDLVASRWSADLVRHFDAALDGGSQNGLGAVTFRVRGNHERHASNVSEWQEYFDGAGVARAAGASGYSELRRDLDYSFDYGNSHFVGLDVTDDLHQLDLAAQLAWLDQDLRAAAARGKVHAFLFWHPPVYTVTREHAAPDDSSQARAVAELVNRHPIVSATFHGHEHLFAYVHMDRSRVANLAHEFEQFITGAAGAPLYACLPGRFDACAPQQGFAAIDVDGLAFTVSFYRLGEPAPTHRWRFEKPSAAPRTPARP
jgi:3',5'-cyclic AMP phosphodiesterase CpdA